MVLKNENFEKQKKNGFRKNGKKNEKLKNG